MAGTADVAGRHILLVSLLHAQLHRAGSLTINREGLRPEASLLPLPAQSLMAVVVSSDHSSLLVHPTPQNGQHMPVTPPRTPNAAAPHRPGAAHLSQPTPSGAWELAAARAGGGCGGSFGGCPLLPLPRTSGAGLDTPATPNRGLYPRTLRGSTRACSLTKGSHSIAFPSPLLLHHTASSIPPFAAQPVLQAPAVAPHPAPRLTPVQATPAADSLILMPPSSLPLALLRLRTLLTLGAPQWPSPGTLSR